MATASEILEDLQAEEARLRKGIRITSVVYGLLIALSIFSTTFTATRIEAETAPEVAAEQATAIIEHIATQVRVDMIRDVRDRSGEWPEQAAAKSREGVERLSSLADKQIAGLVEAAIAPQRPLLDAALTTAVSAQSAEEVMAVVDAQAGAVLAAAMATQDGQSSIEQARRQIAIYWLLASSDERSAVPALLLGRMASGLENLLQHGE